MQVPMEFLDKHGLNDKSDIHNFISNNQDSANQLFNEHKAQLFPYENGQNQAIFQKFPSNEALV